MLPNPIKYHIYHGQDLPEPWPYDYVMAGQGLLKRAVTPHFEVALRIAGRRVAGLPDYPGLGVRLLAPRIPMRLFERVLQHARWAGEYPGNGKLLRPIEQMYHFHWLDDGWRVAVPRQQATFGRVSYSGGHDANIVLDLHSHHQMAAYFSETDNRDEQGCRFYGVLGSIYDRPKLALRLGVYGDFFRVKRQLLFEE